MDLSILTIVCMAAAVCSLISVVVGVSLLRAVTTSQRKEKKAAADDDRIDDDLIAVISAAVYAMGRPGSEFSLVSVGPTGGFTTPVWGHVERFHNRMNSRDLA